ncbi:MAG: LCP family protein [Lachnospiraceae bacterium]|nr:LCP family protein [Lachnospiraceae bacterium]
MNKEENFVADEMTTEESETVVEETVEAEETSVVEEAVSVVEETTGEDMSAVEETAKTEEMPADEGKASIFDGFAIDDETGEVIVPRATVGVVSDDEQVQTDAEGTAASELSYIPVQLDGEELPELRFDFEFGEEEFANSEQTAEEDVILQNIDEALAAQMAVSLGPDEALKEEKSKRKKNLWQRIPLWCRITMISLCSICLVLVLLVGTKPGRKLIYGMVAGYLDEGLTRPDEVTPAPTAEPVNPNQQQPTQPLVEPGENIVTPAPEPENGPRKEEHVYNVLLIGEEALPQFGGRRSDSMILVSINSKDKKIYMTSLMRDLYVQIPGYGDNKLNAAYAYGGPDLLVSTVEKNLHVKIDGYAKVGFDSFEWIVDRLGGVEITLTAQEADYLRKKDYISNPAYRNVVAGTQLMNGNQVLGYCRVRYVPNINGTANDFGRTERQRIVLTKIFEKYKNSGLLSLISIFNDCLPRVETNISKQDIQDLMEAVVENKILNMETFRIPVSGSFDDEAKIGGSYVILVLDWQKNINQLHNKIFGPEE